MNKLPEEIQNKIWKNVYDYVLEELDTAACDFEYYMTSLGKYEGGKKYSAKFGTKFTGVFDYHGYYDGDNSSGEDISDGEGSDCEGIDWEDIIN